MSYQVLARKWRPKNFHELVGQDHVRKALVSALDNDRLHHAYLFTGTRGVGKTTIARIIAKCLNCETGVTSRPCGECSSCREIEEGRFVDLIEVDAASRTKVEDTRELLDNVQYAPSRGRYKVYLIDEVHMLSTHSFNALLKTLEEPPPHVKFLLATTDPQKLPMTVLSRCLQFNLKNMPPERVVEHLSHILTAEQIHFDDPALWQLGRAADGSMRDALSLTDQAIAYGQGQVLAAQVSEMLGLVDHRHVGALIEHLISRDAKALLNEVGQLSEQAADFETILSDMALYLHRMAVAQVLPDAVDNSQGDREQVQAHAARLTAEDVQLYYQIAIKSQEDMPLAPDARTGFEMALIRMVAFAPQGVPANGGDPLPAQNAPMHATTASAPEAGAKKKALTPESGSSADAPADISDTSDPAATVRNARAALSGAKVRTVQFPERSAAKPQPLPAERSESLPAEPSVPSVAAETPADPPAAEPDTAEMSPVDRPPWEDAGVPEATVVPETTVNTAPPPAAAEPKHAPTDHYQAMMPEPLQASDTPPPKRRSDTLPEADNAGLTPLVEPCPPDLQQNQDWLAAFPHLPLRGLDRSLAKNAALVGRQGNQLQFALKAVTGNFLTPEREQSWQASIRKLFSSELTLEIVSHETDLDTPEDHENALKQQRLQQATVLFNEDPVVQGLISRFQADVDPGSIEPLTGTTSESQS